MSPLTDCNTGFESFMSFNSTGVDHLFLTVDKELVPGRRVLIEELSILKPHVGVAVSQRTAGTAVQNHSLSLSHWTKYHLHLELYRSHFL